MPTTFGSPITVNEEVSFEQITPQVMTLADGRVLFTWASNDLDVDGDNNGIAARTGAVQLDGSIIWSAEFTVNEEVQSTQYTPQVTQLSDGRVLFTWRSHDPDVDGASPGISGRVGTIQADGSIIWASAGEFTVNVEVQQDQLGPQVTVLNDGRVLFTWFGRDPDVDGDGSAVSSRIGAVQADGSINWGSAGEFAVNEQVQNDQFDVDVTILPDGRVLYVWYGNDPDIDPSSYGISARVGTPQADGSISWGAAGEVTVNVETLNGQYAPQVIVLNDGCLLFTWFGADPDIDPSGLGLSARVGTVQADGGIVWAAAGEVTIAEQVQNEQGHPQMLLLPDGRVLFTWHSEDPDADGDGHGIVARVGVVQADGAIVWETAEFTVNLWGFGAQLYPQAALLQDGRVIFTWQSSDPSVDGASIGIDARVLSALNIGPTAQDDTYTLAQPANITNGDLFADNGAGVDADGDGDDFDIVAINGVAIPFGPNNFVALPSGAALWVDSDGDFDYESGGAFAHLRYGQSASDSFTYTIDDGFGGLSTATVTINASSAGQIFAATANIDNHSGTDFGDIILGGARADNLFGGRGWDDIYGGAGDDEISGGMGDDLLDGGLDADTIFGGEGNDIIFGRSGDDLVFADDFFQAWQDTVYGGDGADVLHGRDGDDLLDGQNQDDTLYGGNGADQLFGRLNNDMLFGDAGNDALYGGDGGDQLRGGADDDLVDGGNGADTLWGDEGADQIYGRQLGDLIDAGAGADAVYGGDGDDTANGGADNDLLDGGNGNDILAGDQGDDTLYGRQNNDTLSGGAGGDLLYGGDGDDTLSGGDDADTLESGNGIDRLNGGLGSDTLWGGTGADTYVFDTALGAGNIDTVLYFSVAEDVIELSASIFGALSGNFFVIGAAATSADHRIVYDAATGALYFDADGDGAGAAVQFATLSVALMGLTESNFLGGP